MNARPGENRRRVLAAARLGFRESGVRKTTMSDVARAAGVSRQLVYKLFPGRRELVEAAVVARIGELAEELGGPGRGWGGSSEAFVAVSVSVIRRIRTDFELQVLLGEGSPVSLHDALWSEAVRVRGQEFWLPWLRDARAAGLLRGELSDSELSDWLQTVYASIILRRHVDPQSERAMIERFVVTSMTMAGT